MKDRNGTMKKGIIFDMDGTLWDSAANVAKSWNLAIEESRMTDVHLTEADIKSVMGKTMDTIAAVLFPSLSEEVRSELLSKCCGVENDYLREYYIRIWKKH